jgi:sodium-independent sulfate anion transporter 11
VRISRQICDYVYTYRAGIYEQSASSLDHHPESRQRLWNDTRTHHISRLRREASISSSHQSISSNILRLLNKVILDLIRTTHIDTTGLQAIDDMRMQILSWSGPHVPIRIMGANRHVRDRFERHHHQAASNSRKTGENAEGEEVIVRRGW